MLMSNRPPCFEGHLRNRIYVRIEPSVSIRGAVESVRTAVDVFEYVVADGIVHQNFHVAHPLIGQGEVHAPCLSSLNEISVPYLHLRFGQERPDSPLHLPPSCLEHELDVGVVHRIDVSER